MRNFLVIGEAEFIKSNLIRHVIDKIIDIQKFNIFALSYTGNSEFIADLELN